MRRYAAWKSTVVRLSAVQKAGSAMRLATCMTVVALGACSSAACGHAATKLPQAYTDPHAPVPCPRQHAGAAPGAFDARSLIGQTLEEATARARRHGCVLQVLAANGGNGAITGDAQFNRIAVFVDGDLVKGVRSG
jgi:hypothetical protein